MTPEIFKNLNTKQKTAAFHQEGPLLIVAGAGTGKTSVITCRLVYLLEHFKLKPENILAVTFTEKAAEEMEERVDRMLPLGYADLWINTFHGLAERILKEHGLEIGLSLTFKLASEIEQRLILRRHFYEFDLEYFKPLGNPDSVIAALISHFSRAKDEDITPEEYLKFAKIFSGDGAELSRSRVETPRRGAQTDKANDHEKQKYLELARAYQKYQEILLAEDVLDFGDLIAFTLKLLRTRRNVLNKFQKQFRFILVDEFQDTNFAQYQLIKLLAGEKANLTVCADDDQAIYKWRGASVANVLNFKKDFPSAKEVVLTENYRSTQPILDLSYRSIQLNNPDRLEKKNKIQKKLTAQRSGGVKPTYVHLETLEQEVAFVVKRIIELKNEDAKSSRNDFAILVRSNSEADPFLNLLSRQGIPYEFFASRGLYLKPEIIDLLSYLKVLVEPYDNAAFYRVATLEVFGLEQPDLASILEKAAKNSLTLYQAFLNHNDVAGVGASGRQKIDVINDLIEKHAKLAREKSPGEMLLRFLEDSKYLKSFQAKKDLESEKKVLNISLLFKRIQSFEENSYGRGTVRQFVEEIELLRRFGEDPAPAQLQEGPEAVKIMTIHGAKGLEFPNVFVVNLVQDRFPTRRRKEGVELPSKLAKEELPEGDPHLQEERRLFYVALTRAKKRLFLTGAADYGGKRQKKPSVFVNEIREELDSARGNISGANHDLLIKKDHPKIIKNQKLKFKLPAKFSYTQLVAFENCPKQYKFRHLLKIMGKGSAMKSFGNSLHHTLAKFYAEILSVRTRRGGASVHKNIGTLPRLLEIFAENWLPEYYENKTHEKKKKAEGEKILKEYFAKNKKNFSRVLMIEQGFNVKIGQYTFKGVIDRVDDLGGKKVGIIDYKTGKEKNEREVKKDRQLTLYCLAMKQVFKKHPAEVALYFLATGNELIGKRSAAEEKSFVEETIRTIEKMKISDFTSTSGFHCRTCDYQGICEEKKV